MGDTCGMHGEAKRCFQFWLENLRERDHPDNLVVDYKKILT